MTRALVWKEVREQGTVLVALIVLGAAVLIAAAVLLAPTDGGRATELRSLTAAGRIGLIMLTVTAGMVVGGTLFAGEREAGTFAFLDRLPGSRWRVWWRKVLTGAGLVAAAVGVFVAVSAAGGILDLRTRQADWLLLFGVLALAAYGWGVLGSVIARTSLTACGVGLGFGMLTLGVVYPVVGIALNVARRELGLRQYIGGESSAVAVGGPRRHVFAHGDPDPDRGVAVHRPGPVAPSSRRRRSGCRASGALSPPGCGVSPACAGGPAGGGCYG